MADEEENWEEKIQDVLKIYGTNMYNDGYTAALNDVQKQQNEIINKAIEEGEDE